MSFMLTMMKQAVVFISKPSVKQCCVVWLVGKFEKEKKITGRNQRSEKVISRGRSQSSPLYFTIRSLLIPRPLDIDRTVMEVKVHWLYAASTFSFRHPFSGFSLPSLLILVWHMRCMLFSYH